MTKQTPNSATPNSATPYSATRRKPKPATLILIVLLHVLAIYGLAKAFAPDFTRSMEREVLTTFSVDVSEPDAPPPPPPQGIEPSRDEGAQGDPGREAIARNEAAPDIAIPQKKDRAAPPIPADGTQDSSGARAAGDGTGAAGLGFGTGSGRGGTGRGSGGGGAGDGGRIATKPSVASGELNNATDFPVPPGGRGTRFGKSVTVAFTVGTDGRAKNCSVARSGVDAATTSLVCGLVTRKIRFNPAVTVDGRVIEARYGYRVDFTAAD